MEVHESVSEAKIFNDCTDFSINHDHLEKTKSLPCYKHRNKDYYKNWEVDMSTNQNYIRSQLNSSDDHFPKKLKSPPKKRWTVSYDNKNYVKSQLSEEVMDQLIADKKKAVEKKNSIWSSHKRRRNLFDSDTATELL